ncbi:hypothetical protein GE21DRAFT_7826 [Neurospora crassa]|uniref:Uncharacterized protein n=1 Tax=Neurospora crassa (strain ATCC 24698 / 74-OR23-1A / CBS 708.71 / DSM 1257 / FGSC 987) TaxID=367110 RepID=Q7S769_NEUCR|nr:hypothetical protein NCU01392 [Neurospora crassa OR74A]EAA31385.2 hypothetical protein NCU01392 [Neurospora crassa OR74A]KHE79686.1 hypothetical protein GE21DRAFT_7826 [Neurospora crassa]|eukprot:XP_960621.2 hypothetical protein NCU01392 [Neurospora crassa OR74A]
MANRESLLDSGTGNSPISVSGPHSGQRTVAAVVRLLDGSPRHWDQQGLALLGVSYLLQERTPPIPLRNIKVVLTTLTSPPTMDGEMVRLRARSASTANRYLAMEATAWGTTGTHNGLKEPPYRASY